VGYVRLLDAMGFSIGQAEDKVADKYGIEANTLPQWKKAKLIDAGIGEIISLPAKQFRDLSRLNRPPSHKANFKLATRSAPRSTLGVSSGLGAGGRPVAPPVHVDQV
jgi:hypothetical protein